MTMLISHQSIARALYSKREFMIFDDVLSGLDAATENKVFTQVFGPDGILRQGNMSALVVTSSCELTTILMNTINANNLSCPIQLR